MKDLKLKPIQDNRWYSTHCQTNSEQQKIENVYIKGRIK